MSSFSEPFFYEIPLKFAPFTIDPFDYSTFVSPNGDGVDFIMLEQGGNDDLFVQPVLAGSVQNLSHFFLVG